MIMYWVSEYLVLRKEYEANVLKIKELLNKEILNYEHARQQGPGPDSND